MIIEPEKYFQYTIPKLHTLWNGKIRDFSHQAIDGYQYFISAYQDKKLVVLITTSTKDKLQVYYDSMTKQKSNVPLMELSHTGRWYANGFISAYNFCEQYEKEHPSAKVDFALYADNLEQTNEMQSSSNNDFTLKSNKGFLAIAKIAHPLLSRKLKMRWKKKSSCTTQLD